MEPKLILTGSSFQDNDIVINRNPQTNKPESISFDINIEGISYGDFSEYFKGGDLNRLKIITDIMDGKLKLCGMEDA